MGLKLCWQIYLLADRALCKIRRNWVTCCSRWCDGVRKRDQWSSLDSCPYFLWCGASLQSQYGVLIDSRGSGASHERSRAMMASKTIQRQWIALCDATALGGSRRVRGWCHGDDDGDQMSSLRQWAAPAKTPLRWASIAQVGSSIWTRFLHCKAGARSTTTCHGDIL